MKPRVLRACRNVVLTGVAALMLSGCTALSALLGAPDRPARQSHNSSSLVEFLYPGGRIPPAEKGVQRLYSVDVVALVSHDQITHMDENEWSLGYLTIVGAYVLKGSHHDVATLVDLAVVDPVTQSLILRAGGTDSRNRNTTLIDEEREARESGAASFDNATTQMIDNFDAALTKFEADVRAGKANIRVARRESNGRAGGGGSFAPLALGMLLIMLAARLRSSRVGISPRSSRIHCFSHARYPGSR